MMTPFNTSPRHLGHQPPQQRLELSNVIRVPGSV